MPALDSFEFGDGIIDLHPGNQRGDAFEIAIAAACKSYRLNNAVLNFKVNELGTGSACLVLHNIHLTFRRELYETELILFYQSNPVKSTTNKIYVITGVLSAVKICAILQKTNEDQGGLA